MTRFIVLLLFALNCQSPSNPSLADEFVHGEVNMRKRYIKQAFALWGIRGQVEPVKKHQVGDNRIVFTDTCTEEPLRRVQRSCMRTMLNEMVGGGCSFDPERGSTIFIRRTYFQSFPDDIKVALLAHEIGHCVGMPHSDYEFDLMFPWVFSTKPNESEVLHIKRLLPDGQLFKLNLYEAY